MKVKYLLESGLFERKDIHSGRLYREGSPPEYGVIFTANEAKSEDDLGLDTTLILNAFIGLIDDPENERGYCACPALIRRYILNREYKIDHPNGIEIFDQHGVDTFRI